MFNTEWQFWDYLWFIGVPLLFVVVAVVVFLPRYRQRFRDDARIPFRDEKRDKRTVRRS